VQDSPYVFARMLDRGGLRDRVVVALNADTGLKAVPVGDVFPNGARLIDGYSGTEVTVANGRVSLVTPWRTVLLGGTAPVVQDPDELTVRVVVVNNSAYPADIYVAASGARYRLGVVDPASTRTFSLRPETLAGGGRIVLSAVTSATTITPPQLEVSPGDIVDFQLARFLRTSSASVRP
jgi:hypothetical protein